MHYCHTWDKKRGEKRPSFDKKGDRKTPLFLPDKSCMNIVLHLDLKSPAFSIWILVWFFTGLISISIFHQFFSKTQQNWDRHSILFSSKSKQTLKYFRFVDKNGTKFSLSNKACGIILGEFFCFLHISGKKSWKNTKCSSFGDLKLPVGIMQMAAEFFKNFLTRIL